MEAKFTPGPWYLKAASHMNGVLCHEVCHGDDEVIACTETDGMPDSLLIAAAPEMYELLHKLSRVERDTVGLPPMTRMSRVADVCDEIILAFEVIRARINA